jgi:gamma-glutamyltranspeptidase / glutathione hydrolase
VFTTRPELSGTFGMVASTHWLASAAGMAVLESGGNAFDAAAAAGFVLHVAEPHLNGPGGEVPAVFATAADKRPTVLVGQGVAPGGASAARYRDEFGLTLVPGTGLLAATVPGAVGGWLRLLADHGTLPLRSVLSYAIGYAAGGHPAHPRLAATVEGMAAHFAAAWPTSAEVWLPGGRPPRAGELVRRPALAATYERLVAEAEAAGPDRDAQYAAAHRAWYSGFVAEAIDAFCRTCWPDESGATHPGVLTGADLAAWQPSYEAPAAMDWRGVTVHKAGPWSQGPVLLQQLALLGEGELPPPGSAERVHLVVEIAKLAFADRDAWYGDVPDVPMADLLAPEYTAARRALVGPTADDGIRPGSPGGRSPRLPAYQADLVGAVGVALPSLGEPTVGRTGATRGDTCHVDVVDRWGNIISATPSGGWLQSSPSIPELGFCLGTRAQMFWLEDGLPSSLVPGRRPRTTLSPTLVSRAGEPVLACGTPGGDQQDQWQLQFLVNHLVDGLDLQAAIDAPAWHTNGVLSSFHPRAIVPGEIVVEDRLGDEVIDELDRRGHQVTVVDSWSLGRLSAVSRDPDTGVLRAGANARGMQGYAAGR